MTHHKRILIISDIEGSSLCPDYEATTFLGNGWPRACLGMTQDVNAVVTALFNAGVEKVYVKDFHRTGYNLFPTLIDPRATVISGYKKGPVPGIGSPFDATGLMMLGMHAPSGSNGFLAHTFTSRISRIEINGSLVSEAEIFAAVLAPYHLVPIFFSGCPVACSHASEKIKGMDLFPVQRAELTGNTAVENWRNALAAAAVNAIASQRKRPFDPKGPFNTAVTMNNRTAVKLEKRWGYTRKEAVLYFQSDTISDLYLELIRLAYLSPLTLRLLPMGLGLYNLLGWAGLKWASRQIVSPSAG